MKKIILTLLLGSTIGIHSYAQCNQRVTFNASKTDYIDSKGSVQQTKDEQTVVNYDNEDLSILNNGEQWTGTIVSSSCDWKKNYAEGKTVLRANVSAKQGDAHNAVVTVEGKDGNVSMVLEMDNMPLRKFQMTADAFREIQ